MCWRPATHAVFAAYGGDTNYPASNSSTVNLSRGISTSLTLTASSGTTVQRRADGTVDGDADAQHATTASRRRAR